MPRKKRNRHLGRYLLSLWVAAAAAIPGYGAERPPAITGVTLPEGFRDWVAVAPSHRTDKKHIRLILGNALAAQTARQKTLPYPDGAILAKLVYNAEKSAEWEEAIVPGAPVSLEFMVKDSEKYKGTGGWGFGRFGPDGKPLGDEALYRTCFPCHEANVKSNDFVFTRWAP